MIGVFEVQSPKIMTSLGKTLVSTSRAHACPALNETIVRRSEHLMFHGNLSQFVNRPSSVM